MTRSVSRNEKRMLAALKLAQAALNTAPRFKIPSLPKEHDDSYKVAAVLDETVRLAEGRRRSPEIIAYERAVKAMQARDEARRERRRKKP
jgi:hypothetical protein